MKRHGYSATVWMDIMLVGTGWAIEGKSIPQEGGNEFACLEAAEFGVVYPHASDRYRDFRL